MLSIELKIKCPHCDKTSAIGDWDDCSYAECITREMRRAYKSILNESVFNVKSNTAYKCPKCGNWIRGSQLIIESDDPKLKRLGRKPLTTIDGRKIIRHRHTE